MIVSELVEIPVWVLLTVVAAIIAAGAAGFWVEHRRRARPSRAAAS